MHTRAVLILPTIRLAVPADAPAIARLSRDEIEHDLGWSWRQGRVERAMLDESVNVAVAGPRHALLGFGIMEYGDTRAHLSLLAVAPAHRRQGLGSRLVAWLEKCAVTAGLESVRLEARADNPAAAAFYQRLGYRLSGRTPDYYSGQVDALRFEKPLRTP